MNVEDYITNQITNNIDCDNETIKKIVVEDALKKYRRNQFKHIEQLVYDARKMIHKLMKKQDK